MRQFNKVFVIALPRCATVSVGAALGVLGIRVAHLGKICGEAGPEHNDPERLIRMHDQIFAGDFDLDILKECDGLTDYPACVFEVFEQLDRQYPESLFINVRRDRNPEGWLQSAERQFVGLQLLKTGKESSERDRRFMKVMHAFRGMTFGQVAFDANAFREAYDRYQERVIDYFAGRNCLLNIADISELDDGFEILCRFLDCEVPFTEFPRSNDHSDAPRQAFFAALERGEIESQTGITLPADARAGK